MRPPPAIREAERRDEEAAGLQAPAGPAFEKAGRPHHPGRRQASTPEHAILNGTGPHYFPPLEKTCVSRSTASPVPPRRTVADGSAAVGRVMVSSPVGIFSVIS
jgi:hypothetical protein